VLHFLTPAKVVLIQGDDNKNYSLRNSIELFTVVSCISAATYGSFVVKHVVISLQQLLRFSSETYQNFLHTVKESHIAEQVMSSHSIKHANVTPKDHE